MMADYQFLKNFKITIIPESIKNPEIKKPQYIPKLPEHMLLNISEKILRYRKTNPIINRTITIIFIILYQLLNSFVCPSEKKKEGDLGDSQVLNMSQVIRNPILGESENSQCEKELWKLPSYPNTPLTTSHQTERNISKQRRLSGILPFRLLSLLLLYSSFRFLLSPPLNKEVSLKNNVQKLVAGNLHMPCELAHLPFLTVLREFEQDFFISFAFFAFFPSLLLQSNNGWMTNHHSSCSNIVFFVDGISYLLLNFFIATKKDIFNETIVTKMGDYPLKELVLILFLFAFSDRIVSLPLTEVSQ